VKIALLDFVFPKGHVNFNLKIAVLFSSISDLLVVSNKKDSNAVEFDKKYKQFRVWDITLFEKGPLSARMVYLIYMIIQRLILLRVEHEKVVVLTFDVIVYAVGQFIYSGKDIYLMHHNNVDELRSKFKLFAFKSYMNKVNHIVLSDYIKDYLINAIGVEASRVSVVPHPMPNNIDQFNNNANLSNKDRIRIVGISNSNDENMIEEIINYEQEHHLLKKNNCEMILKSKRHSYNNGSLIVSNEYYSKEKYEDLLDSATYILILFSEKYQYRVSGTLFDAIARKKVVISTNIMFINFIKKEYPNICTSFSSAGDLMSIVTGDEIYVLKEEIDKFLKYHSDQNVENILYRLMEAR
jgi:hypothetical protein